MINSWSVKWAGSQHNIWGDFLHSSEAHIVQPQWTAAAQAAEEDQSKEWLVRQSHNYWISMDKQIYNTITHVYLCLYTRTHSESLCCHVRSSYLLLSSTVNSSTSSSSCDLSCCWWTSRGWWVVLHTQEKKWLVGWTISELQKNSNYMDKDKLKGL